jgi:tetratricopeptide (TPR) repeat protein
MYLGARTGLPEQEIRALFDEAARTAEEDTDFRARAVLFGQYGAIRTGAGDVQAGARYTAEAVEAADRTRDRALQVWARFVATISNAALGRFEEVCRLHEESEVLCGGEAGYELEVLGFRPYPGSLVFYGFALDVLGRGEQSDLAFHRVAALRQRTQDAFVACMVHQFASIRFALRGDGARALAEGRLGFEAALASSNTTLLSLGRFALAEGLLSGERWQEAIEAFRELRAFCRDQRVSLQLEPTYLTGMAAAQLGSGDWRGALETADEALAIAERRQTPGVVPASEMVRARAWLAGRGPDAPARADEALARAERCALELEARSYLPRIHEVRAEVAAARDDAAARERALGEAERLFREIGWPQRADRAARALQS